jgi:hypothetical protein
MGIFWNKPVELIQTRTIKDNIQTCKEIRQAVLYEEEIDEDWATKSNWICIDHLCPNPYTHARGDPCKLTMEELFPSHPEPSTSEDARQPEDNSEDWLIEWDKKNNLCPQKTYQF